MALVFGIAVLIASLGPGFSAPPTEVDVRKKIEKVNTQLKASQAELDEANTQEQELANQLGVAESQLEDFSEKLREARTQMTDAVAQLELVNQKIRIAKSELVRSQFALERRLKDVEMQNETSYLGVLLQADSFSDFLNQTEYMQKILQADQSLIDRVKKQRDRLDIQQKAHQHAIERIAQVKDVYQDRVDQLDELHSKQASLLAKLQTHRKKLQAYVVELEHTSLEMETKLQKIIRERQHKEEALPTMGRFIYPVQGPITSPFGYRVHPITGVTKFHSGLDFGVDYGTRIRAADNGRVIYADWYGGYGNCVIIEHGNGISTLYGHCSELLTKEGAIVGQGTTIALVGSTGMSTGPHLHFEVRQDGTPIDPHSRL